MNDEKICLTLLLLVTSNELYPRLGRFPSITNATPFLFFSFFFLFLYLAKTISLIESDALPTKYIHIEQKKKKIIHENKLHTFIPPFHFPLAVVFMEWLYSE